MTKKLKNSKEKAQKRVDYEKLRKRNEKLRKELIHHVKIHKESVKVSRLALRFFENFRILVDFILRESVKFSNFVKLFW